MPYTKQTWTDEVPASTPVRYKISESTDGDITPDAKIEVVTSVTAGSPVNATRLNYMEDGIETAQETAEAAIPKSLATAANQLLKATTADTWESVLLNKITYPARAKRSTGQNVSSGTTIIAWDSETFDPENAFTTGVNAKYTAPIDGYYQITSSIRILATTAFGTSNEGKLYLYKNGASYSLFFEFQGDGATQINSLCGCDTVYLLAGEYIDTRVTHDQGTGTVQITEGFVAISRIG